MRKWRIGVAIGMLSVAAARAETAEELIARNIQARGGLAKIKSIQSMRLTGTLSLGDEKMPSVLELKRPHKMRWEFTVDGQTAVQAYDGKAGWIFMPSEGQTAPQAMSAEELEDIARQADMDGPLVDAQAKGNRIELVGPDKVDDRDAWKLKVTLPGGEVRFIDLDAKTYLQILSVTTKSVDGSDVEIESEIGDYRDVGGVLLPHSFEARAKGMRQKQTLKFDKIERDVPIDDSRFQMPEPKKPALSPGRSPTPATG